MRANILYAASTWRKERSRQKKTRVKQRRWRKVVTGRAEVKKEKREKNGQSLDGSACRAGIALHAGLKTSARNIATAKALICNLLPLPSAFYRATFPRTRRWNGMSKRSKDNTVQTRGSPVVWSTRDDTLLKYTCDRAKQLKLRKTVSSDFCGEATYIFFPLRWETRDTSVCEESIEIERYMLFIFVKSVLWVLQKYYLWFTRTF